MMLEAWRLIAALRCITGGGGISGYGPRGTGLTRFFRRRVRKPCVVRAFHCTSLVSYPQWLVVWSGRVTHRRRRRRLCDRPPAACG